MRKNLTTRDQQDPASFQAQARPPLPNRVRSLLPGLALCLAGASLSIGVGYLVPAVSSLLVAILLGAVLANVAPVPPVVQPGVAFSIKTLLQIGIALLGLQVLLSDILGLGWQMIAVVIAIVVLGISGTMLVGNWLGLSWAQRVLIACGFSVCGTTAVAAVDGVIKAEEEEVLTALALTVIFGTLMIPAIPLFSVALGLSDTEAGLWAGGAVHNVAQVVPAGGAIGATALSVAVVVKLARVLMLAPIIAGLSIRQRKVSGTNSDTKRPPLVPLFIIAFVGLVVLRSTGILPETALEFAEIVQTILLSTAMFALGLGVRIVLIKRVGVRPFMLATISTLWVSGIALVGILLAQMAS